MRNLPEFNKHPWPFGQQKNTTDLLPTFRGVVHHVVDGDTFDVIIDLGFRDFAYQTIRLRGVDAPEIYHPSNPAELALGQKAAAIAISTLLDQPVILLTEKDKETFGRFIAEVYFFAPQLNDWISFKQVLVDEHLTKADVR